MMLERHRYVVDSFQFPHLQDVAHLGALQNLVEQNLDVHLPYQDAVRQLVFVVDVELRRLLRKDYFQVVVDVEPHSVLRKDYFRDVVL